MLYSQIRRAAATCTHFDAELTFCRSLQVVYLSANRKEVLRLLREHITTNLVKIGPQLFRQKDGIPQGSVLSSLLCSLFYGDMEQHKLSFTKDSQSVSLRHPVYSTAR